MKNTSTKSVKSKSVSVKSKVAKGRGRPLKYAFNKLIKVGDSLLAPLEKRNNFVTSAYLFCKRHGFRVKSEQLEKTVRIRRIA